MQIQKVRAIGGQTPGFYKVTAASDGRKPVSQSELGEPFTVRREQRTRGNAEGRRAICDDGREPSFQIRAGSYRDGLQREAQRLRRGFSLLYGEARCRIPLVGQDRHAGRARHHESYELESLRSQLTRDRGEA